MSPEPDPFYNPVYFDSCAFDGGGETEEQASLEASVVSRK